MTVASLRRDDAAAMHLHLWLGALNRTLRAAVEARSKRHARMKGRAAPEGLGTHQADVLLADLDRLNREGPGALPAIGLTSREQEAERQLLEAAPTHLPLVLLRRVAGLSEFELRALLAIAASEVSPDYGRLFGFVLDDMTRLAPSIELIVHLTHAPGLPAGARRRVLGPGGTLRRLGLVTAANPLAAARDTVLRLAPGMYEWLAGASLSPPVPLTDPALMRPVRGDAQELDRLGEGWRAARRCLAGQANALVAVWDCEAGRADETVMQLCAGAGLAAYAADVSLEQEGWTEALRLAAFRAAGCDAVLWIDTDVLLTRGAAEAQAARVVAGLPCRVILTGRAPWRPGELLAVRAYAEIGDAGAAPLPGPWPVAEGELDAESAALAYARARLGWRQRRAALAIARGAVRFGSNGVVPELGSELEKASQIIATPRPGPSARLIQPRRTLEDLVLPDALHAQVAEIGRFHTAAERVDRQWGFGRLMGSAGAVKVLFTGQPGTGKTLAAEVIAGLAGTALLKVDLSQVVSKWIGETEKNLEAVFDHAEQSKAALFFDEADALFGKRGEVRHGTDRFANMEVSFLLQRLETFSGGLVILASNLRDEIDPAFSRRFQIALHFPKPEQPERERLWRLALAEAPLAPDVRFDELAALELTGGAIVGAARMAALLAASEDCGQIGEEHLVAAIERQFRKEARLMTGATRLNGLRVAQGRC